MASCGSLGRDSERGGGTVLVNVEKNAIIEDFLLDFEVCAY